MAKKAIELIEYQIEKLNEKEFDLGSWKNSTIIILSRIFGKDSEKIGLIKNINYDYSSWTLRDTSGASAADMVKKLGRDILETAIQELKLFGQPEKKDETNLPSSVIQSALEDHLRVSQFRELMAIIRDTKELGSRKKEIASRLQTYGDETVREILAAILAQLPDENTR